MLLENAMRKLVNSGVRNSDISINYDDIIEMSYIDNEPEYSEDMVEIISGFKMVVLSCYIQPVYVDSSAMAVFRGGDRLEINRLGKALERVIIYYNFNGVLIDYFDKKLEFIGKNIGNFNLDFRDNILYTMDFACLKNGEFYENISDIELLPFGGRYSFGDNPAMIEQQLCHISRSNGEADIKGSKLSDWKNRGIIFNRSDFFIKELQKKLSYSSDLSKLQKYNLSEIISNGDIKIQLKDLVSDSGSQQFESKYFRHILGTNYIDIIFIES